MRGVSSPRQGSLCLIARDCWSVAARLPERTQGCYVGVWRCADPKHNRRGQRMNYTSAPFGGDHSSFGQCASMHICRRFVCLRTPLHETLKGFERSNWRIASRPRALSPTLSLLSREGVNHHPHICLPSSLTVSQEPPCSWHNTGSDFPLDT